MNTTPRYKMILLKLVKDVRFVLDVITLLNPELIYKNTPICF